MNQSNYITASQNYAKNAQDAYEQSLSYLLTGLDEAKIADQKAANVRYENLINKIRQQLPGIQQQFEKNAKAAYINKQQIESFDNVLISLKTKDSSVPVIFGFDKFCTDPNDYLVTYTALFSSIISSNSLSRILSITILHLILFLIYKQDADFSTYPTRIVRAV